LLSELVLLGPAALAVEGVLQRQLHRLVEVLAGLAIMVMQVHQKPRVLGH